MTAILHTLRGICARFATSAADFVSRPASARPLAFWRIGVAAVLLVQAWFCASSLFEVYGSDGIVTWSLTEALLEPGVPRVRWITEALAPYGIGEVECIRGLFALHVMSLAGLMLGWRTRWMAVLAWATQLTLKASGKLMAYGVDEFANISLFYFMWMPVEHAWSLDRLAGRVSSAPSAWARLSLRVLQVHLCIVYLSSGIVKGSGEEWRSGEAIWYALMRPDFGQMDFSWLAEKPWIPFLACWATVIVEAGYAVMVWPKWTRTFWALAAVGLHLGIALFMGLWTFAAVMIVLTTSAFLISAEPAAPTNVPSPDQRIRTRSVNRPSAGRKLVAMIR